MVYPRDAITAKGLLLACIRDKNPTLFFEPKRLYRASVQDVPLGDFEVSKYVRRCVRACVRAWVGAWVSE